ncbi:MAG: hypothetical protein H6Q63_188 [Firmicutes bacterium]|nr:hypothetical protein [Bacillota bacterium]
MNRKSKINFISKRIQSPTKTLRFALGLGLIFLVVYFFFNTPTASIFAVETTGQEFKIVTTPESGLFRVPNMAPGDKVSAPLAVKNMGQRDFCYDVTARLDSGDKLYTILELIIKDGNGKIRYLGKLKDLQNIALGILAAGNSESYEFTISFPFECGNDYQGKMTSMTFIFNATEHPQTLDGGIVWDPPLEKPDVTVRKGIVMPIKFHILNNGVLDKEKRGVDLVITGNDSSGLPVVYKFSVVDGTLDWEEHGLSNPHYSVMFDTSIYPVAPDTFYNAKVKYGDQILGTTEFKSGH